MPDENKTETAGADLQSVTRLNRWRGFAIRDPVTSLARICNP